MCVVEFAYGWRQLAPLLLTLVVTIISMLALFAKSGSEPSQSTNFRQERSDFKIAQLATTGETVGEAKAMTEDAKYGRSAITDEPFESLKARFLETVRQSPATSRPARPRLSACERRNSAPRHR